MVVAAAEFAACGHAALAWTSQAVPFAETLAGASEDTPSGDAPSEEASPVRTPSAQCSHWAAGGPWAGCAWAAQADAALNS